MKTIYLSFVVSILLSLSMTQVAYSETISPVRTDQSACKYGNYTHSRSESDNQYRTKINYNEGTLTLTVYNVIANCAASVTSECRKISSNELHFVVIEEVGDLVASCICEYDVECKYEGIAPGYYDIYVENEYGYVLAQTSATIESDCELLFSKPSGVEETQLSKSGMIKFSASKVLSICAEGVTTLETYDAQGSLILKMEVEGNREISLTSLPKGIYLLNVSNGTYRESLIIRI
ncbi:MAG: T9SS type A sorting domain-containing protein [Muribaculaceae bacterium]|nr:T9SS type A sorting domain-containing protein [Muribaculaceae bacterium]